MLSGSFKTTQVDYNEIVLGGDPIQIHTKFRLNWSATQDPITNTSTVTWTLTAEQTSSPAGYYRTCYKRYVKVGNSTTQATTNIRVYNNTVVLNGVTVVPHNEDGTLTLKISAGVQVGESNYNSTGSKSFVLDTIQRVSTITCNPHAAMGSRIQVSVAQTNQDWYHILSYKTPADDDYLLIGYGHGDSSYQWDVPDITDELTDAETAEYTLLCETYFTSDYTGDHIDSTKTLTAIVPAAAVPSVTVDGVAEGNPNVTSGLWVRNYSMPIFTVTFTGYEGSTCVEKSVTFGDETVVSTNPTPTEALALTKPITSGGVATVKVKDSRGREGTTTFALFVLNYKDPKILGLDLTRCDANGDVDPAGEYLNVKVAWQFDTSMASADINIYQDGTLKDTVTVTTWTQRTLTQITRLSGILVTQGYTIKAEIIDDLAAARTALGIPQPNAVQIVPASIVPFSLYDDSNGVGASFGEAADSPGLRVTQQMFEDGNLADYLARKTLTLWQNSSPSSSFAAQSITLATDDYDYYEIIFNQVTSVDYYMTSGKIPKGHGTRLTAMFISTGGIGGRTRAVDYTDDTTLAVAVGRYLNAGQSSATNDNTACIPIMIIGYKE